MVGIALLVLLPVVLVFVLLLGAKGRLRVNRFYAAWIATLALAFILPIAIPAAIWPPSYYDDSTGSADCASIAKDYAADGMPPMVLYPVKTTIIRCTGFGPADSGYGMFVDLEARGPYGIRFATAQVTETEIHYYDENGARELFATVALLVGMVGVSLPFVAILLSARARRVRHATA
jgi:hypothetical protein